MKTRSLFILALVVMLVLPAVPASAQEVTITFWTTENQPARAERQQAIIDRFTEATGINVQMVLADENLLDQLMTLNQAAGTLPDVVFHPMTNTAKWYAQGLLNAEAATAVIENLGKDTFAAGALGLVDTGEGTYMAVPADGWGQLLVYRADLFEAAGLEPPTTYDAIMTAAQTLHDPDTGMIGMLAGTHPGEVFTLQCFEQVALANGAELVDADGNILAESPEMIEAIQFYADLLSNYGPEGEYYWLETRADYLDGKGAMVIWSPFILDEMAGLRDSVLPTCPECEENPAFIAEQSAVISAFAGPSGSPAQWGQVSYMGITSSAPPEAQQFVEFWLSEGYVDWLAVAAEGKFPMRTGTAENPTEYLDAWRNLEVGVDTRAPLSDFYSEETLNIVVSGANNYNRWGFGKGQDLLASAVSSSPIIQENVVAVINGELTAEEAAEEIQIAVEDMQMELEAEE
jgi:multiple sugar transport system substrate-binding protein